MAPEGDFCTVRISPGALATIAGITAMRVPGVHRMSGGLAAGVSKLVGRDNPTKGVRVKVQGDEVSIDLHVVVEQGADLVRVGSQIQREVALAIDKMVGVPLNAINVYVKDME